MVKNEETLPLKRQYGPYMCYRIIGMGESNIVYRAKHTDTKQSFALRVIRLTSHENTESIIEECMEELESLKLIESDYIVPTLDFGTEQHSLYIAMRDMRGETLMHRQKAFPTLQPSLGEVGDVLERLSLALDQVHLLGMIHGQLEPRNILFDEEGKAYLGDVGLARLLKIIFKLGSSNSFTMSKYSAPEVWVGERPSPASDQYALACIVYQMITGKPPFEGNSVFDLMIRHRDDIIELPHYHRENVPVALTMPLLRALAKQPDQRFPKAIKFHEEYTQAIRGFEGKSSDYFTKNIY